MENTVGQYLATASRTLHDKGIQTSRLDTLLMLESVLGENRGWILAHDDTQLTAQQIEKLNKLFRERENHVPMAYILGYSEFYGREFIIDQHVLVPRPESEAMIDLLKQLPEVTNHLTIVDVGTGSGALGITAKLELPRCPVYLLEIDDNSLKTAKSNVDKFAADLFLIKSDLLANMKASADILLCNLPYVPDDYEINKAAKHEPAISLFGGQDGLDLYRKLFREINNLDYKPLYVLTEALSFQHKNLKAIAAEFGYKETKIASLIQQFEREK